MLHRPRRGFTLIELLVVLGVISLLVALLLPSLAKTRERARYIRWKGYSHGLRVNPEISAYFNFEEQDGSETKSNKYDSIQLYGNPYPTIVALPSRLSVVYNRAAGDPFEQSKGRNARQSAYVSTVEPGLRDLFLLPASSGDYTTQAVVNGQLPQWTNRFGRWQGKGALMFGGPSTNIPTGFGVSGKGRDCIAVSQDWDGVVGDSDRTMAFWARSFAPSRGQTNGYGIADWGRNDGIAGIGTRFSVRTRYDGVSVEAPRVLFEGALVVDPVAHPLSDVRDGQWHWVVVTATRSASGASYLEPQDVRFYVDGRDFGNSSSNSNQVQTTVNQFCVGNDLTGQIGWTGVIDEVQVWRTALTVDRKESNANGAQVLAGSIFENYQAGAPESRR